jgi:hypothetical protein
MPPRVITVTIVVCWLAITGWLVHRDLWRRAGEPPALVFDLADEVGTRKAFWNVLHKQEPARPGFLWRPPYRQVGSAETTVRRHKDRSFELQSVLRLSDLSYQGARVRSVASTCRVGPRGELRDLTCTVTVELLRESRVELSGRVEGGRFRSSVVSDGREAAQEPFEVPASGRVLNVLQPLHKLAGLRAGRTWRVPFVDPLSLAAGANVGKRVFEAKVSAAPLFWHVQEEACWRIDYQEVGGPLAARAWMRQEDGLLLQQEVRYADMELVLQRRLFR